MGGVGEGPLLELFYISHLLQKSELVLKQVRKTQLSVSLPKAEIISDCWTPENSLPYTI